jgi:hypothetical protein
MAREEKVLVMVHLAGIIPFFVNDLQLRAAGERIVAVGLPAAPQVLSPGDIVSLSQDQKLKHLLSMLARHLEAGQLVAPEGYLSTKVELLPADPTLPAEAILSVKLGQPLAPQCIVIEVVSLAQAEMIASDAVESPEKPLGLTGVVMVGQQPVILEKGDSIAQVAAKITRAAGGVTALVEPTVEGKPRLVLTTTPQPGPGPAMVVLKNGPSASPLVDLGLQVSSKLPAHVQGERAQGDLFPVRSSPVAAMLGLPANGKLTLTLLGKVIPIDLGVDSLERIENKINRRLPEGLRAQIDLGPGGPAGFRLTLPVAALRDAGDNDNVLEVLGLLKRLPKQTLVAGREAVVIVDGKRLMASGNLFEEIVPGMKIALSGTNRGVPVQVSVVLDAVELVKKMELVIEDVNRIMVALGQQQAQQDPTAGASQGARGLQQLKESLFTILFQRVAGNVIYETPESIGIRVSQNLLGLDSKALEAALSSNPNEAARVVRSVNVGLYDLVNLFIDPRVVVDAELRQRAAQEAEEGREDSRAEQRAFERERQGLEGRLKTLQDLLDESRLLRDLFSARAVADPAEEVLEAEILEGPDDALALSDEEGITHSESLVIAAEVGGTPAPALLEPAIADPENDARVLAAFMALTRQAVEEPDLDAYLNLLSARKPLAQRLLGGACCVADDDARACLEQERHVIDRLAAERTRALDGMEKLSFAWKARQHYRARFPFPPMPAFFGSRP